MKRLIFVAILLLASSVVVNAQIAPQPPQQQQSVKVYSKQIDSINVVGLPFNVLLIRSITINSATVTVQSALAYVGASKSKGSIPLNDSWDITDTDNISYYEVIKKVALLHKLNLN